MDSHILNHEEIRLKILENKENPHVFFLRSKKGISKISGNNHGENARTSLPNDILKFLNADIGDKLVWKKAEDFLSREIILIDVQKLDGTISKTLSLKPLEKDEF